MHQIQYQVSSKFKPSVTLYRVEFNVGEVFSSGWGFVSRIRNHSVQL